MNAGNSGFKDLFSTQAQQYMLFRPRYPATLFSFLSEQCKGHERVWDVGTGNGQAALALVPYFKEIFASDPSTQQIENATLHPRIKYQVGAAEHCSLPDNSVDLITVAQAFHWFRPGEFFAEARRVAKEGAILAVWTYAVAHISDEVDAVVSELYSNVLASYWESERRLVENGYRDIAFPFRERQTPQFSLEADWTLEELIGYLRTWSATQSYLKKNGKDPLDFVLESLGKAWGNEALRRIRWPLSLRLFEIDRQ